MPLEINWKDFDTVCYSTQHNIMQLIKHAISIGVQVNINIDNIQNVQDQLQTVGQEGHDAFLLAQNLNERVSDLETRVTAMWSNDALFNGSPLGHRITAIEDQL